MQSISRRDFVRLGAGAVAAGAAIKATLLEPPVLAAQTNSGGRQIRFVSIGTGIRGCDLLRSARKVPNGVLVGTADLYDMHQKAGTLSKTKYLATMLRSPATWAIIRISMGTWPHGMRLHKISRPNAALRRT